MADTAASLTGTEPHSRRAGASGENNSDNEPAFDILAFMALYFGTMKEISQDPLQRMLSDVFLDNQLLSLASHSGSGGSFAVSIVKSEDVARFQQHKKTLNITEVLPHSIALRVPKPAPAAEHEQKQRILTSMAKEIVVLTNEGVRACDNIVKLFGTCWTYTDSEKIALLPVLVYEAAPLGDLDAFLLSHKNLPLGHQLQLCVDIALGVERLHRLGVIHCDLKPKDIIIFPTGNSKRPYKAKVADFGCAIMLDDVNISARPPPGTRFWNPPEQLDGSVVSKDQLPRIDVFTLALVIMAILTSNQSTDTMMYINRQQPSVTPSQDHRMGLDYFKRWGSLAISGLMIVERFSNLVVTQRSSVKANAFERLTPPQLLDDDNSLDYSERWIKQIGSVLFRALQGSIADRDCTARDIASVLEAIHVSVEIWGQRDHVRVDLHEVVSPTGIKVSASYVLESQSRDIFERATTWIVIKETERMIAVQPGWYLQPNPHTNLQYVYPRMTAATNPESWEDSLFGSETDKKRPWMAIYKHAGRVVKLTNYLGNMSLMPGPLLEYVMRVLDRVAMDSRESAERRSIAAYELALGLMAYSIDESKEDGDKDEIARALQLLDVALDNGHREAKWTVGWAHDSFGRRFLDEKLQWLSEGMVAGSRIAARRLRRLDHSRYKQTRRLIQTDYQGIGEGWRILPEYVQENPIWYDRPIPESNQILLAAAAGVEDRLKTLIRRGVNINATDAMGETPLVAACRSGHVKIVEYLIEQGADVSILSKERISALHFLSSFEDEDIPYVALLLLAAGCPLEVYSTGHAHLNNGHTGTDRFYGLVNGTPLLWAVASDNLRAVVTLLDFGADSFDNANSTSPHSPVSWAASMHQAGMLEHLFSAPAVRDLKASLNPDPSTYSNPFRGSPLNPAAAYSGGLALYRMQLHESQHRDMCRRTIHLLLSKGADPTRSDNSGLPALHYAGIYGQPYAFQALLAWDDKLRKLDTKSWVNLFMGTVINDRRSTFKELLKIPFETTEAYSWPEIIATVAGIHNTRYYLNTLISHLQESVQAPVDCTIAFEKALHNDCFENAKVVFDRADKCDVVNRQHVDAKNDGQNLLKTMTLLGRLMRRSLIYASELSAVREFLEITGGRDILFKDVLTGSDGDYNALQLAVGYAPYSKSKTVTTGLLETVLKHFKHPIRHLGTIHNVKNRSLLHLAVRHGNIYAVEVLLNYAGINFAHHDDEGGTAFDRALNRLQDSWRDKELAFWEVPIDQLEEARLQWENNTRAIIQVMQAKGLSKYSTYSHVFKRLSNEKVRRWIIYPHDGRIEVTDYEISTFEPGEVTDKVSKLAIGGCTYLAMFTEAAKKMSGSTQMDITDLLEQMKVGATANASLLAPDSRSR